MDEVVARYLDCGILDRGFARIRCRRCPEEFLVAFSCKGRGVCPSCGAKRAAELAAFLQEEVVEEVGHAQWVFTVPKMLRVYFLHHRELLGGLSRAAYETVKELMVTAVAEEEGFRPEMVSVVQNFHPHVHTLGSRRRRWADLIRRVYEIDPPCLFSLRGRNARGGVHHRTLAHQAHPRSSPQAREGPSPASPRPAAGGQSRLRSASHAELAGTRTPARMDLHPVSQTWGPIQISPCHGRTPGVIGGGKIYKLEDALKTLTSTDGREYRFHDQRTYPSGPYPFTMTHTIGCTASPDVRDGRSALDQRFMAIRRAMRSSSGGWVENRFPSD